MPVLSVDELRALCEQVFRAGHFTPEETSACAEEVVDAQSRGRRSHGIAMIPRLLEWKAKAEGQPQVVHDTPVAARIVGNGALGPLVARQAMDLAASKAERSSIGLVGVENRSAFLTAGHNPRRAARRGLVALNSSVAPSNVAVWGGASSIIGTNPLGIGVPAAPEPIVLDLSVSEMSVAQVRAAARAKGALPEGAAVSKEGQPTTDPQEALEGALLTFGAHKGSGLAVMLELLAGPLVGGKAGTALGGMRGMLFLAIDPDVFGIGERFLEGVNAFAAEVRGSVPRPELEEVLLPGDRGERLAAQAAREGVEIDGEAHARLLELANGGA